MKNTKLQQHLLSSSNEKSDIDLAMNEWICDEISIYQPSMCPCGHKIIERCRIRNVINNNVSYVGSTCINQFKEFNTKSGFRILWKLKKHNHLSHQMLNSLEQQNKMSESEVLFYKQIQSGGFSCSDETKKWLDYIHNRIVDLTGTIPSNQYVLPTDVFLFLESDEGNKKSKDAKSELIEMSYLTNPLTTEEINRFEYLRKTPPNWISPTSNCYDAITTLREIMKKRTGE